MTESPHLNIVRMQGAELENAGVSAFVCATFIRSIWRSARSHVSLFRRALNKPGTVLLLATPVGDPTFVGWLAARPAENRIVACYTKAAYRASPEQRAGRPLSEGDDAFRIASSLALAAGIDFSRPVPCSFWSRAARAIREKAGNPYSLKYDPEERR